MNDSKSDDPLAYLEKLDAWLDDEDEGMVPMTLLKERGIEMPEAGSLTDADLSKSLDRVITAMADIGFFLHSTNHLSDRELYSRLRDDVLLEPAFLMPGNPAASQHQDFVGSGSDEDQLLYLTYYADDGDRAAWAKNFPRYAMPEKRTPPFDRDRTLPTMEERQALHARKH